jgi:hypothetical protein
MSGHLDPPVAEEEMAHFGGHPQLAGLNPRDRHDGGVRVLQAVGAAQTAPACAELDHADLPGLARRRPVRGRITT